ncbi:MAG: class I SAM-dependent methyltransferase [Gammaproteobacteria bacterium]|nr:MAG: class I SAM-dependent methyltransferase [Gammaproteobacteria bacterium]
MWSQTNLGRYIIDQESEQINQEINRVPGVNILQLGAMRGTKWLNLNRRCNCYVLDTPQHCNNDCALFGKFESLPFQAESMDVVILRHTLEATQNPQEVLHEAERILSPDGYIVISGFNPYSLFGVLRFAEKYTTYGPWEGNSISIGRIKDWFAVLGLDLTVERRVKLSHKVIKKEYGDHFEFLGDLADYSLSVRSGVYVLMARKRTIPLTLQKSKWIDKGKRINSPIQASPKIKS